MTSERFVSSHIEKTGGISMKKFFVDLYGSEQVFWYHPYEDGFVRADQDPTMRRLNTGSFKVKALLLASPAGRLLYPYACRLIHKMEKPAFQKEAPEEFTVIHGHFSPSDVDVSDARLVTVFREPLERVVSHYGYWRDSLNRGQPVPSWFDSNMSFGDFALSSHMSNFQSSSVGRGGFDQFDHVGVTGKLGDYCRYFDPEKTVVLLWLNKSLSKKGQDLDSGFVEEFRAKNETDYKYYEQAKNFRKR